MKKKRTLYDCFHAKVFIDRIRCDEGHTLNRLSSDGFLPITELIRGEPLVRNVCQHCSYFEQMDGDEVLSEDRGWMKLYKTRT